MHNHRCSRRQARHRSYRKLLNLETVYDIPVQVTVVLGRTVRCRSTGAICSSSVAGAVIELDKKVGEAIDIFVNNRLVARGEVVVVEERIGITMTEVIKAGETLV